MPGRQKIKITRLEISWSKAECECFLIATVLCHQKKKKKKKEENSGGEAKTKRRQFMLGRGRGGGVCSNLMSGLSSEGASFQSFMRCWYTSTCIMWFQQVWEDFDFQR